jgi:hypothetical protein
MDVRNISLCKGRMKIEGVSEQVNNEREREREREKRRI